MNILVYRPAGGLGDMITALPTLAGLRRKYPDAKISFLSLDSYEDLARRTGCVNEFIRLRRGPRRKDMDRGQMHLALRRAHIVDNFDLVANLWCPAAVHENETNFRVTKSRIECFCDAAGVEASTPVLPLTEAELAAADRTIETLGLKRPMVMVQIHSANIAKDWPRANWQTLVTGLRISGASIFAPRMQGPELTGAVGSAGAPLVNAIGLGIIQMAAIAARSDLAIALDSGLLHIAGAVGTKCLALFGPTDPVTTLRFYPRARALFHSEVAEEIGCHCPCYYNAGNGFRANGHCVAEGDCMRAIRPSEVLSAALEMLK